MKKFLILVFFVTGCATQAPFTWQTDSDDLLSYSSHITPEFLQQHLGVVAHDSLEGRATGMTGQKKAAHYLADFYTELGFRPVGDEGTYFQHFMLNAEFTDSLVYKTLRIEGADTVQVSKTVESGHSHGDYFRLFGGTRPLKGEIVFAGFGLNDEDRDVLHLEGASLKDKWVMIFEDIPYVVDGDTLVNPAITTNSRFGAILGQREALGILVISDYSNDEFVDLARIGAGLLSRPSGMRLAYLDDNNPRGGFPRGFVQISPAMAAQIMGLENEHQLFEMKGSLTSSIRDFRAEETSYVLDYTPYDGPGYLETENVAAFFEGADPALKDEALVLVAHYDHVGISQPDEQGDTINNGADDNGSGTVALMTIANAFAQAAADGYRPKRSILFLHVSAEEVGLLGSRYYSDHPVIPIENTVAAFNADMIGRSDAENIRRGDTDYVYLIGGEIISSGLDSLVQVGNTRSVNMRLDPRYNDLQDPNQFYRRSDHWNFGRLGIPFVFFFTGVHADYHRPSDTVDKIDFAKLARVTQLIYSSSIEVTNYEGRPEVDNTEFIEITGQMPRQ